MGTYERVATDNSLAEDATARVLSGGLSGLYGAPLDFVKAAAAFFMVLDHYNTIILGRAEVWLFRFGRIAFPLFCLAVAAHVVRNRDTRGKSLGILLVFAVATQPFYSWAFQTLFGNVLFTLAAGSAIAVFLARQGTLVRHGVLALAFAAGWLVPQYSNAASDYGMIGMMIPAALALTAIGGASYLPWAIAYVASANAFPHTDLPDWWVEPAIDAAFAIVGGAVVIIAATAFAGRARFLPRYFLHVFYPAHIALLATLRALL